MFKKIPSILLLLLLTIVLPAFGGNSTRDFDAINDYVNFGSGTSIDNLATFTWAAWIMPDTEGEGTGGMIIAQSQSNITYKEVRTPTTGINRLEGFVGFSSGTNANSISTDSGVTLDVWQFVVMTYDNSGDKTIRLYVNGSEVSYGTQTAGSGTIRDVSAMNVVIGNDETDTANSFDGGIAYVQIFDRVLTVVEMKEIMYHPGSIINGLKLFSPVWGDSTEVDLSGNGNTGTPSGTTMVATGPSILLGYGTN